MIEFLGAGLPGVWRKGREPGNDENKMQIACKFKKIIYFNCLGIYSGFLAFMFLTYW
jgi:hypothetical protein